MAGYHSFELCYLAAIYTNLLIKKQSMDFYFCPEPNAWENNILRVAPDLLPKGTIELSEVWIEGKSYKDFDKEKMHIFLPESDKSLKIRCRIAPVGISFDSDLINFEDGIAEFALKGQLNESTVNDLKKSIEKLSGLKGLILDLSDLDKISDIGWNYLLFTKQRAGADYTLEITNANETIKQSLKDAELDEEFQLA
jgi:anti-anti-sigma regulatory factor